MDNDRVPTEEEIAQLPRWARVAFAARCARRVQPLFCELLPNPLPRHVDAIEDAITVAEVAASIGINADSDIQVLDAAHETTVTEAAFVAWSAYEALMSAIETDSNHRRVAFAAVDAITADSNATQYVSNDFRQLLELSEEEHWTDETTVSPSVFPPLNGPIPQKDNFDQDQRVIFTLQAFASNIVSPEMVARRLVETYKALNEYTLAAYGVHLSRGRFRRLILVHAGVKI